MSEENKEQKAVTPRTPEDLKMYILIKDTVPIGHALNSTAHAAMAAFELWHGNEMFQDWFHHSFKKVTCKVTLNQFEKAKEVEDHIIISEENLEGKEVVMIFLPRFDWPNPVRKMRLYK